MAQPQNGAIDVGSLDLQQLSNIRSQLTQELEHLTASFGQLKLAQARFRSCIDSLENLNEKNKGKESLIPLTASLYVKGTIDDVERVTVDVGTGYYITKRIPEAKEFYKSRITFVNGSLEQLQDTITKKQDNMRVVAEVMQSKSLEAQRNAQLLSKDPAVAEAAAKQAGLTG